MCIQIGGGDDRFFLENLYGYFGAAEGKVPLLMVCVKRKPLHLVFYAQLGESTPIIAGICLCRIAGRRMDSGFGSESTRSGRNVSGAWCSGSRSGSGIGRAMTRSYARRQGGTRCGNGAVSVEGCGRGGKRGREAGNGFLRRPRSPHGRRASSSASGRIAAGGALLPAGGDWGGREQK
jgi:hypothetical protein